MTDLIIDPETGEIIDDGDFDSESLLAALVRKRVAAKEQEDAWAKQRKMLDAQILGRMDSGRAVIDDVIVRVGGGTYAKTDAVRFAEGLNLDEVPRSALVATIAAATAFKREALPEEALRAYGDTTQTLPKSNWIETSVVLRRAPEAQKGDAE